MKFLQRFCFPLLCCALLLGAFSVSANAEEIRPYHIYTTSAIYTWYGSYGYTPITYIPHNGTREDNVSSLTVTIAKHNPALMFKSEYYVANDDGSALVHSGGEVTLSLESVQDKIIIQTIDGKSSIHVAHIPNTASATVYFTDGTTQAINATVTQRNNNYFDLKAVFMPNKDVKQIAFATQQNLDWENFQSYMTPSGNDFRTTVFRALGEVAGDQYYSLVVSQDSKEVGLLGSIIDKVSSGFSDLKNGISNVVNGIADLPSKIWGFIENGLKSLFVPSEDYLVSYKDKWTALLSDRLGAVWQVTEITFGAWGDIDSSDETNTITIPATTLDLPDNTSFTFGGIDVQIVPEPFIFLADTVKLITSILATFLFINGIRKRYDEVMGVEQ